MHEDVVVFDRAVSGNAVPFRQRPHVLIAGKAETVVIGVDIRQGRRLKISQLCKLPCNRMLRDRRVHKIRLMQGRFFASSDNASGRMVANMRYEMSGFAAAASYELGQFISDLSQRRR